MSGERIRTERTARRMTLEKLAEATGLSAGQISRMESAKRGAKLEFQLLIARALGLSPSAILDDEEISVYRAGGDMVRMVEVRGTVQAGHWEEAWEWPPDDRSAVPIPDDDTYKALSLYAVETRGNSMDKRYPAGTIVVYTDQIERGEPLVSGRRYIVERERPDGLREATVKTLWQDDLGAMWLLPESTDPRHQSPIPIVGTEGETIRIVGRVVYAVTRED